MKISILLCTIALQVAVAAQGRGGLVVDLKIYFPYDQSYIDSAYMGNSQTLAIADFLLRDSAYISTLSKIDITAQSSPEGSVGYNSRLSERRRLSLKSYFTTQYPQIDTALWSFNAVAENWELFHQNLEEDLDLPNRDEMLAISASDRHADAKEWLLRTADGGRPWQYIKSNILPKQRFGASILFVPMLYAPIVAPRPDEPELIVAPLEFPMGRDPYMPKLIFAIKTNMVLDLASVVNIAVEVPIGERWSVVGEMVHPWWRAVNSDFTMQIESYHAEVKYWLGDRSQHEQLQGWSAGLYGGWGRFDVQPFGNDGVQGSLKDIGLQLGYAHSIGRNLNLEYNVGVGYITTQYNDYSMAMDSDGYGYIKVIPYPWMNNRLRSIFPTRCGVSLVWTIKSKRGGDYESS